MNLLIKFNTRLHFNTLQQNFWKVLFWMDDRHLPRFYGMFELMVISNAVYFIPPILFQDFDDLS